MAAESIFQFLVVWLPGLAESHGAGKGCRISVLQCAFSFDEDFRGNVFALSRFLSCFLFVCFLLFVCLFLFLVGPALFPRPVRALVNAFFSLCSTFVGKENKGVATKKASTSCTLAWLLCLIGASYVNNCCRPWFRWSQAWSVSMWSYFRTLVLSGETCILEKLNGWGREVVMVSTRLQGRR